MKISTEWQVLKVSDQTEMRAFIAKPEGKKSSLPGVLVLQEIFGVNKHIREVTEHIAALGYVAAAPEIFHRSAGPGFESGYEDKEEARKHMQALTDEGLEADIKAAYDLLKNHPEVDKKHIAAVGFCLGGRAAFLANSVLPLACAASYYGGGIAERYSARVKDQHGPILFFWGGKDTHIGPKQQHAIAEALREAGKPFVDVEFSEANHGFFCDAREGYNPEAAGQSWVLLKEFFKNHLGA